MHPQTISERFVRYYQNLGKDFRAVVISAKVQEALQKPQKPTI